MDELEPLRRVIARRDALLSPTPEATYDQLEAEEPEIERALERAVASDPELAIEAASLLRGFWFQRGRLAAGRGWAERLLAAAPEGSAAHALASVTLAALAFRQGDNELAKSSSERAIAEGRALGRQDIEVDGLLRRAEEGLRDDDAEATIRYASEARALARRLRDARSELSALHRLAEGTRIGGDLDAARPLYVESLERNRVRGDRLLVAVESINLGFVEQATGKPEVAERLIRDAIGVAGQIGSTYLLCAGLVGLAGILAATDRAAEAARVIGKAEALYDAAGLVPDPADKPGFDSAIASARETLGDAEYERLHAAGASLDPATLAG
jgi:tetratricopeptide (TPR) repeat protein